MTDSIAILGSFVAQMSVYLPRQPYLGETIVANDFDMGPGGKGNNMAIAAKRLGAEVLLIERVGNDFFSDLAFDIYERENIETKYVYRTDDEKTGVGLVYVQPDGENTAALFKGANEYLSSEDILQAREKLITSKLLLANLEIPDEAIETAVKLANQNGITVVVNPAPAREIPDEIMKKIDILTPNVIEAAFLAGEKPEKDISIEKVKYIAQKIRAKGPDKVIITLGSRGALLTTDKNTLFQPSFNVNNVDTVGAGDSFNAALCVWIVRGYSLKEALEKACINGAITTTINGVINALPYTKDVDNFILNYKDSK